MPTKLERFWVSRATIERIKSPDEAKSGQFRVTPALKIFVGGKNEHIDNLCLEVSLKLEGFAVEGKKKNVESESNRSFCVDLTAQGEFEVLSKVDADTFAPDKPLIATLLYTLYPLLVAKLMDYAADIGYRNVEPTMGVALEDLFRDIEDITPI